MTLTPLQSASVAVLKSCLHDDMCDLLDGVIDSIMRGRPDMPESLSPAEQAIWNEFGGHAPLVIQMKKQFPKLKPGDLLDKINHELPAVDTTGFGEKLLDLWPELKDVTEVNA